MKWVLENRKNIEWIFTSPSDTPFLNKSLVNKFLSTNFNNLIQAAFNAIYSELALTFRYSS